MRDALIKVAVVGWVLVLGVAAYVSATRDEPTAREQTSVSFARPAVDRAVGLLVEAGLVGAVVAVAPFVRVGSCRISAVRDGERWEQAVTFFVPPGGERALLDRLAAPLGGRVRERGGLRADAGDYVGVFGDTAQPGEVRVTVETGCRTGTAAGVSTVAPPVSPELRAVLDALPLTGTVRWSAFEVPCASGTIRVVTASGPSADTPLTSVLGPVGLAPVIAEASRYAYRVGSTSVVVRRGDTGLTATATTPC